MYTHKSLCPLLHDKSELNWEDYEIYGTLEWRRNHLHDNNTLIALLSNDKNRYS